MPSQYSLDIPFCASHDQQAFKLIELPPELLALLESENPPKSAFLDSSPASMLTELSIDSL
jgi:sister chromatid cohesion protein DCC1